MKKGTILGIICLASSFIFPVTGFAYDGKAYPGSMCQAYFGGNVNRINKYDGGKSTNVSNSAVWVTCPVVKDNLLNRNGTYFVTMVVWRGTNANDAFYCKFQNTDETGQVVFSDDEISYLSGNTTLTFGLTRNNLRSSYVFLCRIPTNSEIISYVVDEYDSNI